MKLRSVDVQKVALGVVSGLTGAIFVVGPFRYPDMREFRILRVACSLVIGAGLLWGSCRLLRKGFARPITDSAPPASGAVPEGRGWLAAVIQGGRDGFRVFVVSSVAANLFCVVFRGYELNPTYDVLHMIPMVLMNEVWETLICRSGSSVILFLVAVVVFDGVIGLLVGMMLPPLQRVTHSSIPAMVILVAAFGAYWWACITFLAFRC